MQYKEFKILIVTISELNKKILTLARRKQLLKIALIYKIDRIYLLQKIIQATQL